MNFDLLHTVITVLYALPRMQKLRPQLEAALPPQELAVFDALAELAHAAQHAQILLTITPRRPYRTSLYEEGLALRSLLRADITLLERRGILPRLRKERAIKIGLQNIGYDLMAMAARLLNEWDAIEGRTALTSADIRSAQSLSAELLAASFAVRTKHERRQAADDRRRAATLLVRAYENARAAIVFIRRREGDADVIAPSLYAYRTGRRRKPRPPKPVPSAA